MGRVRAFVVLALLLGACGEEGGDEVATEEDAVQLMYHMSHELSGDDADRLEEIIKHRLGAVGVDDVSIEMSGDTVRVELPSGAAGELGDLTGLLAVTAELRFRPVLLQMPPPGGDENAPIQATPPDEDDADETVVLDQPGEARFQLGPAGANGEIIEDAEAELAPTGQWQIALTLTPEGVDAFNAMATRCSPPSTSCPTGQLALVLDSEVLSAPTVQAPSFERDDIVISGRFTEDEAHNLAIALRYGSLPTSLGLVEAG